jgi:methyl coenzyme M reductase subunit C
MAPEFQILSQSSAFYRANFAYRASHNAISSQIQIDLTNFAELAADTNATTQTASLTTMLNAVSQALLGGPMPQEMLNSIMPAMLATKDANTRARNAVFLVAASPQYQVQR